MATGERDYRRRYDLPIHWIADEAGHQGIDYFGYLSLVLELIPAGPLDVLDAGCGDGRVAAELVKRGHRVLGVDYSDRAIGYARILVPGAEFACGDLLTLEKVLSFDRQFDLVILVEVLEHLPPEAQPRVLEDLRRRLRPGGQMVLTVPSVLLPLNPWHYKHFTRDEIEGMVAACGLLPERVVFNYRVNLWSRLLFSRSLPWRMISNRHYDLAFARRALRRLFEAKFKVAPSAARAGRFIVLARCVA